MKYNFTTFKRLFFLYFFAFLPLGLISEVLAFFKISNIELNSFPILGVNGFLGMIIYTIIFSGSFALVNLIGINIKATYIKENKVNSALIGSNFDNQYFNYNIRAVKDDETISSDHFPDFSTKIAS